LFPLVRAEILRLLLTNKDQELYVRELARLSFLSLRTVQDELAKLRAARLVLSRTNGYHRFYRANRRHTLPKFATDCHHCCHPPKTEDCDQEKETSLMRTQLDDFTP